MELVQLTCPNCNANIEIDNNREFGFCSYCGTKIAIKKDIPQTNIEQILINNGTIINGTSTSSIVDNLILRAEDFLAKGNIQEAVNYYNRVLDLDIRNEKANTGLKHIETNKLLNIARHINQTGDKIKTGAAYADVLKVDPDNPEAIRVLDYLKNEVDTKRKSSIFWNKIGCLYPSIVVLLFGLLLAIPTSSDSGNLTLLVFGIVCLFISLHKLHIAKSMNSDRYNVEIIKKNFK